MIFASLQQRQTELSQTYTHTNGVSLLAMFQAEISTTLPSDKVHWLLQLAHILFQYMVLMLPGAIIVYAVKQDKLCPPYGKLINLSISRQVS